MTKSEATPLLDARRAHRAVTVMTVLCGYVFFPATVSLRQTEIGQGSKG